MRITFSHSSNAVYIRIAENETGAGVQVESLDPSGHLLNVDFTDDGRLLGIEILEASACLPKDFLDAAEQIDVD